MRARIFSSDMREKMRGTHMSKFHAPTPLNMFDFIIIPYFCFYIIEYKYLYVRRPDDVSTVLKVSLKSS